MEVNVAEEESKFGLKTEEVLPFVEKSVRISHMSRVCGLMTIAPFVDRPGGKSSVFSQIYINYILTLRRKTIDNDTVSVLSMGMTNDYEVAIEEGATMVRVGTGIFGARNYNI